MSAALGLLALMAALLAGIFLYGIHAGRKTAEGEAEHEKNDRVDAALLVRDRLRHDAGFAMRVRKRFTR